MERVGRANLPRLRAPLGRGTQRAAAATPQRAATAANAQTKVTRVPVLNRSASNVPRLLYLRKVPFPSDFQASLRDLDRFRMPLHNEDKDFRGLPVTVQSHNALIAVDEDEVPIYYSIATAALTITLWLLLKTRFDKTIVAILLIAMHCLSAPARTRTTTHGRLVPYAPCGFTR